MSESDCHSTASWQPTTSLATVKRRAEITHRLRHWFHQQDILEVETPQLSRSAATDPNIESFAVSGNSPSKSSGELCGRYLRTSAEFHLKRLLAAGFPDVYELGKVFRVDESGRHHNPEFTMLEWYRLGIDHLQLIKEVESLLSYLHADETLSVSCISYRDFWKQHTGIDLAFSNSSHVSTYLEGNGVAVPNSVADNFDALQDLAMGTVLAQCMPKDQYSCLFDYPASQASLARIDRSNSEWPVANRFEFYFGPVELANGFYELTDSAEQKARFESDNKNRAGNQQVVMPIDFDFIAALDSGMPGCAGVAIGIDRLMVILLDDIESLQQVITFPWDRA